jgi:hypothetical protein
MAGWEGGKQPKRQTAKETRGRAHEFRCLASISGSGWTAGSSQPRPLAASASRWGSCTTTRAMALTNGRPNKQTENKQKFPLWGGYLWGGSGQWICHLLLSSNSIKELFSALSPFHSIRRLLALAVNGRHRLRLPDNFECSLGQPIKIGLEIRAASASSSPIQSKWRSRHSIQFNSIYSFHSFLFCFRLNAFRLCGSPSSHGRPSSFTLFSQFHTEAVHAFDFGGGKRQSDEPANVFECCA